MNKTIALVSTTFTYTDGTTDVVAVFPIPAPVVPTTDSVVEVDVKMADGSEEKFVPETPVNPNA